MWQSCGCHDTVHFSHNYAKYSPILIFFTGRLSNKPFSIWLLTISLHLKCVTTVPCNLLLITALVCDGRSLADSNVLQGNASTHIRWGGIFNKYFAANLLENLTVKKFENRLRINRDAAISLVTPCFGTRCRSDWNSQFSDVECRAQFVGR